MTHLKYELDHFALARGLQNSIVAQMTPEKNRSGLEKVVEVVVMGSVELAKFDIGLGKEHNVSGNEVVEGRVVLCIHVCVQIGAGRDFVPCATQLTTAHQVDVLGARSESSTDQIPHPQFRKHCLKDLLKRGVGGGKRFRNFVLVRNEVRRRDWLKWMEFHKLNSLFFLSTNLLGSP